MTLSRNLTPRTVLLHTLTRLNDAGSGLFAMNGVNGTQTVLLWTSMFRASARPGR